MINKSELVFAVDEDNNPIEPVERRKAHQQGIWHRTTDIAVVNSKKEILVSKRSMLKDSSPGLWDGAFGGHILAGVEPVMGAIEELSEESGLKAQPEDLEFVAINKFISRNQKNKEFRYFYIYRWDGEINDLKLETDEIDEAEWVTSEFLKTNRDNSQEWVPLPYLDQLLMKIENERS